MNPWPFVMAAYGVAGIATAALVIWAMISMRRAESAADALRRE